MSRTPNVSGGSCKRCGARIVWAKRPDGNGWHRPVEEVDPSRLLTVFQDGRLKKVEGPLFQIHECSAAAIAAHEASKALFAATHYPNSSQPLAYLKNACPKCKAGVDEPCRPISEQYKLSAYGDLPHLQWCHPERVKLAENP